MSEIKEKYKIINTILDIVFTTISLLAVALLIAIVGFYLDYQQTKLVGTLMRVTTLVFVVQEFIRWFIVKDLKSYFKKRLIENILAFLIILQYIIQPISYITKITSFDLIDITFVYFGLLQVIVFIAFFIRFFKYNAYIGRVKLHPVFITAISFAVMIVIGTLFLMLPKATPIDYSISFLDALFTATSAVCVTGLNVIDIYSGFTTLGKIIILILIQIGGIGVMVLSAFVASFFLGGLSYKMRVMVKEMLSEDNLSEVSIILKRITIFTFTFEFLGVILLYFSLGSNLNELNLSNLTLAIFHSISSFCNAGFSTFPNGLYNSGLHENYFFLSVTMFLIVAGSLGYIVIYEIYIYYLYRIKKKIKKRLTLTSRIVLVTTISIIIIGSILIIIFDAYERETWMSWFDKIYHSVFLVITGRGCGLNTIDIGKLPTIALLIVAVIMWIGTSPGSTGGGIKETTFTVILLHFFNYIRGKEHVEIYHRRIDKGTILKSQMIFVSAFLVLFIVIFALVFFQPDMELRDLVFESISALSTTGLSTGITSNLIAPSKIIIILAMYIGRIGTLSFFLAFSSEKEELKYDIPSEKIIVG